MKKFSEDFYKFVDKVKFNKHFAYLRYSDGELRVLQNKRVIIDTNRVCVGDHDNKINWSISENEHKEFNPEKHGWVRDNLIETFTYNDDEYYKGISCRCCLSGKHGMTPTEEFDWQVNLSGLDKNDERLTWSNLFLNGNYPLFLEHMLPYFFNYEIVYICNKNYNPQRFPLSKKIKKYFTVGPNCMVNDYGLIDTMKSYVLENNLKNHLFLFSAGSLSNFIIYELWKLNKENTYIDIGSTLNPYLGFPLDRRYLRGFWSGAPDGLEDMRKVCIW